MNEIIIDGAPMKLYWVVEDFCAIRSHKLEAKFIFRLTCFRIVEAVAN